MAALKAQFYTSRLAIEAAQISQDPVSGEEVKVWAVVNGMEAIAAAVAPTTVQSVGAKEFRSPSQTVYTATWQISLNGLWPAITPQMRARFEDSRVYNILGVEQDSHATLTRLKVERVT